MTFCTADAKSGANITVALPLGGGIMCQPRESAFAVEYSYNQQVNIALSLSESIKVFAVLVMVLLLIGYYSEAR